jgi:hypothetical protein
MGSRSHLLDYPVTDVNQDEGSRFCGEKRLRRHILRRSKSNHPDSVCHVGVACLVTSGSGVSSLEFSSLVGKWLSSSAANPEFDCDGVNGGCITSHLNGVFRYQMLVLLYNCHSMEEGKGLCTTSPHAFAGEMEFMRRKCTVTLRCWQWQSLTPRRSGE